MVLSPQLNSVYVKFIKTCNLSNTFVPFVFLKYLKVTFCTEIRLTISKFVRKKKYMKITIVFVLYLSLFLVLTSITLLIEVFTVVFILRVPQSQNYRSSDTYRIRGSILDGKNTCKSFKTNRNLRKFLCHIYCFFILIWIDVCIKGWKNEKVNERGKNAQLVVASSKCPLITSSLFVSCYKFKKKQEERVMINWKIPQYEIHLVAFMVFDHYALRF